jgi:hypothetical protein
MGGDRFDNDWRPDQTAPSQPIIPNDGLVGPNPKAAQLLSSLQQSVKIAGGRTGDGGQSDLVGSPGNRSGPLS